jgi:hypothetical protein
MRLFARPPRAEEELRMRTNTEAAGWLLTGVAAVHAAFGLWMGRRPLLAIAHDGFVDAVDPHVDRNFVFWFLIASPLLWMLGRFARWLAAEGRRPPAWLGRNLLAVALVGAALMPASGFWLIVPPAALLLLAARTGGRPLRGEG